MIWSIIALSKLQHAVADNNNKPINNRNTKETIIDKQLLEELAHYCSFANAAYGWKGFVFCGRWHPFGGNNRMLLRTTGINKRDLVTANWHSKASRPVSALSVSIVYICFAHSNCMNTNLLSTLYTGILHSTRYKAKSNSIEYQRVSKSS